MIYKYVLLSIFLLAFFTPAVLSTPPQEPPCYEIKDPEQYKDLVNNSEAYSYFQDWELKNITVPACQYGGALIQVILAYDVPGSYSPNNLTYSTEVVYVILGKDLHNTDELINFYRDYKYHIQDFENDPAIKFFIETTSVKKVDNNNHPEQRIESSRHFTLSSYKYLFSWDEIPGKDNGKLMDFVEQRYGIDWIKNAKIEKIDNGKTIKASTGINFLLLRRMDDKNIHLKIDNYDNYYFPVIAKEEDGKLNIYNYQIDHLKYDFIKSSIESFHYGDPELIKNLDLFFPNISKIPQVEEFKRNKEINYVSFDNNRLVLRSDKGSLTYDIESKTFPSYFLYNDLKWETFPEISKAHEIIREKLLIGELSNCTIITNAYGHTEVESYNSQNLYIKVSLKCDGIKDGTRSTEAFLILHPDGTYERLEIRGYYQEKNGTFKQPGLYILISILFLILVVLNKVNNARKTEKDTFLKPTKWKMISAIFITLFGIYSMLNCYFFSGSGCGPFILPFFIISFPLLIILEPIGDMLNNPLILSIIFVILSLLYPYLIACIFSGIIKKLRKK